MVEVVLQIQAGAEVLYLCEHVELHAARVQHKSHIQKVMFLATVARLRRDTIRNRNFGGKIGIFPSTRRLHAQRNSRIMNTVTVETKTVKLTKEVYKRKMVDEIFPAIERVLPGGPGNALVQKDNAPAHRINDDPEVLAAGTRMAGTSGSPTSRPIAPTSTSLI